MRTCSLWLVLGMGSAFGQSGCPGLSFSSASSAALASSPSTHRVLVKQGASYTAYELSNASPYSVIRTTPHFETQVRSCAPGVTGLSDAIPFVVARSQAGGFLFGVAVNPDATLITAFDAGMNFIGQESQSGFSAEVFADVNGDGNPDIVGIEFLNQGEEGVFISLGNGGASFQPPIPLPIAAFGIASIAAGDVNGDHKPDLVVATFTPGNGAQGIWVLPGNGDGTFQTPKLVASASQASSLAIADLNADGKPDLVFSSEDSHDDPEVSVALGAGDGTFGPAVAYPAGRAGPIVIGDANGDGIPDIVTAGVTIWFGDGKGGFPTRRDVLLDTQDYPEESLIVTDFDGDGIADIVAVSGSETGDGSVIAGDALSVLFGLGRGTFAGPPVSLVPNFLASDEQLTAVAAADLDGDGIPDLVLADSSINVTVLKGAGNGSFQSTVSFPVAEPPSTIAFADFNHDGNLDFAVVGSGAIAGIEVVLGKGAGAFQPPLQIQTPTGAYAFAVGDFNGDGTPDLAVLLSQYALGKSDAVQIMLGNGDGTFSVKTTYPAGPFATAIAVGDFNGDGKLDLIAADMGTDAQNYQDGNLALLSGKGDGTFAAPVIMPLSGGLSTGPFDLVAADFNRDGKLDIAVAFSDFSNFSGGLAILLGRGDGAFQAPMTYAAIGVSIAVGDMNGDGIPDLLTSGSGDGPGLRYLLGRGDGSFDSPVAFAAGSYALYATQPLAVADFNGDGKLDIAAVSRPGVDVFLNTSQAPAAVTIVSAASFAPGPLAPDSIATAFGLNLPAGPSVSIQDSAGTTQPASVLYSSPSQINYYIPAGLDPGPATVTIGSLSTPVVVAPVAPSLFVANTQGFAAAYVTHVSPGGAATNEPIYSVQNGVVTPIPIDVSAASGQAYLILFGTGLRDAAGTIGINGETPQVLYAGPQPSFPGLDQVNVALPAALAGSGNTRIYLTAGGLAANPVYVTIK